VRILGRSWRGEGVREECENSREIVKRKRSERRVWEFQGDREEERGWCFWGRSSGKISLACQNLWCEGHTYHTLCMLLGWQRICSRFYETKRLKEKYLWEQWSKGISVVRNMRNSYVLKWKGVLKSIFLLTFCSQKYFWVLKKEREMLCGSLLWLRHLWSLLKMLLQALDGTAMWCFFLILSWAFFAQFFLGLSQVTCWSLIFLFFFKFCLGVDNFSWPLQSW